jgi:hypothetical protein
MTAFREFFLIVAGGLIGSFLGIIFGGLVGLCFPDFVAMLWHPVPINGQVLAIAMGMGMICGLPVGAMTMAAGRFVSAIRWWAGLRDQPVQTTKIDDQPF